MARVTALLLNLCYVLRSAAAQEVLTHAYGVNGFSLHPPYFNLAEGTQITATATCGEGASARPIEDLYCKLVGGPVSGDPSQTIQVLTYCVCVCEPLPLSQSLLLAAVFNPPL